MRETFLCMLRVCVEQGLATCTAKEMGAGEGRWKEEQSRWCYKFSPECFRNTWKTCHVRREIGGRLGRSNGLERKMETTRKVSEV